MQFSAMLTRRAVVAIMVCAALPICGHTEEPGALDKPTTQTVTGIVIKFTNAPTGEIDGFELDSGATVHYPRSLQRQVAAVIARDNRVSVTGLVGSETRTLNLIEAETITNLMTSQTLELEKLLLEGGPSPTTSQPRPAVLSQ